MKPDFSVVVPAFNRAVLLEKIIASFASQSDEFKNIELLICDSESTDGTAEMLSRWVAKYPKLIKHIHTVNNVSRKRNEGLKRSTGEYIIFLDDDCIPAPNFIETYRLLSATLVNTGRKTVLCGETRFPGEWVSKSNYFRFRDSRHFGHDAAAAGVPLNFKTIVTMNMCVHRNIFTAGVGGFDETFVGYGAEDQELGWRLQQAGFSIRACPAYVTHHEMSRDIRAFGDKIRRTGRDGATQLLKVAPEAARSIRLARMLDADYPNRTFVDRLVLAVVRAVLALSLHQPLGWLLIKTDRVRTLYCPPAYRAYMACCYALGARQRAHRLSATQAGAGWVGSTD